jgi:hypothetical protein
VWLAGETVEVTVDAGVVSVHHRGVLVATHVQRHRPDKQAAALQRAPRRRPVPRQATVGQPVTRKVDSSGSISFAGASDRVGRAHRRRQVQLAIVGDVVEISSGGRIIKTHPIRHDRSREHRGVGEALLSVTAYTEYVFLLGMTVPEEPPRPSLSSAYGVSQQEAPCGTLLSRFSGAPLGTTKEAQPWRLRQLLCGAPCRVRSCGWDR